MYTHIYQIKLRYFNKHLHHLHQRIECKCWKWPPSAPWHSRQRWATELQAATKAATGTGKQDCPISWRAADCGYALSNSHVHKLSASSTAFKFQYHFKISLFCSKLNRPSTILSIWIMGNDTAMSYVKYAPYNVPVVKQYMETDSKVNNPH
jgi:hypothetical protein